MLRLVEAHSDILIKIENLRRLHLLVSHDMFVRQPLQVNSVICFFRDFNELVSHYKFLLIFSIAPISFFRYFNEVEHDLELQM